MAAAGCSWSRQVPCLPTNTGHTIQVIGASLFRAKSAKLKDCRGVCSAYLQFITLKSLLTILHSDVCDVVRFSRWTHSLSLAISQDGLQA